MILKKDKNPCKNMYKKIHDKINARKRFFLLNIEMIFKLFMSRNNISQISIM